MDLQFRTFYIIRNIIQVNKDLAIRIVETDLMDILFAIKDIHDEKLVNEKVFFSKINFRLFFLIERIFYFRIEKLHPILLKSV